MKKIWIVTEMFHPDETATSYVMTKIAERLSNDFEVNVICGPIDKTSRITEMPLSEKVNVIRSSRFDFDKNSIIKRCLRFIGISMQLAYTALRHINRGDKVLVVTNPAPILLLFSIIKRLKKIELVILVHDVFPENALAANIVKNPNGIFYKILKKIFDNAYACADKLIVIGRDMQEVIQKKIQSVKKVIPNILIVENWADIDSIYPISVNRKEVLGVDTTNKIVLQYAGNIGRAQGLRQFIECFHRSNNDNIHLSLWGNGAVLLELKKYVTDHRVQNVSFHGAYMRHQQNEILNSCDISIITLAENMYGLGVPSKSYNVMAAGSTILYIGHPQSEIAQCVQEHNIGYAIDNKQDHIIEFLKNLKLSNIKEIKDKGIHSRSVAEKLYARDVILDKFVKYFIN